MTKTKIEWCDYSWNPIKGICPERCWFCYARRIYERFKLDPKPWLDIAELNMTVHTKRTGKRVFVCSTFELFNPIADGQWRDYIFDVIQRRPDLTFIVLTKRPERIDRPMPPNVWLGVSVTGAKDAWRIRELSKVEARVKFASLEPFLGDAPNPRETQELNWLIIGRLTGHGHKHDPSQDKLGLIVNQAISSNIPIFLKDNLSQIWPHGLFQEFPEGTRE